MDVITIKGKCTACLIQVLELKTRWIKSGKFPFLLLPFRAKRGCGAWS